MRNHGTGGRWLVLACATTLVLGCSSDSSVQSSSGNDAGHGTGGATSTGGAGGSTAGTGGTPTGGTSSGNGGASTGGTAAGSGGTPSSGGTDGGVAGSDGGEEAGESATLTGVTSQFSDVRQGMGSFTVTVTGTGLTNPTDFDFQGVTVAGVKSGATDTSFSIACSVPHGATLGAKTLSFKAGGTQLEQADVVTVTPITAATTGSDTGRGSTSDPFRTYKQAVTSSASGDTVQLEDGTYDVPGGEDFNEKIPDGVTLQGQSLNTVLAGPAEQGTSPTVACVTTLGSATVSTLTVKYCLDGISVSGAGTVNLEDIVANANTHSGLSVSAAATINVTNKAATSAFSKGVGNGVGVFVDDPGAVLSLTGTQIDSNGGEGIRFNKPSATFTMTGGELNLNGAGAGFGAVMYSQNPGTVPLNLTFDGTTIHDNGYYSIYVTFGFVKLSLKNLDIQGTVNVQSVSATSTFAFDHVTATEPSAAAPAGAQKDSFLSSFGSGTLTMTSSSISGFNVGINQNGGAAKIRGTSITVPQSGSRGIMIGAGTLDLGTALDDGNNVFVAPNDASHYGLADGRSAATGAVPIDVSKTTFNGVTPPAGTPSASVNGEYQISGNSAAIDFH